MGRLTAVILALVGALALAASGAAADGPRVTVLTATGTVDSVMAGYLSEGVRQAANDGAAAVVIRLDTLGGSLDATSDIVQTLLDAPLPTIVWVAPAGGQAASAGTFITLAANIALMAPGTNIGAASPVSSGGNLEGDERAKAFSYATTKIRSIAETRHRNVDWAVSTVQDAHASSAAEAVQLKAVDGLAATLDEVLAVADGRTVSVGGHDVQLALAGAVTEELGMNPFQGFLHLLSDPNIAFVLFTLGFIGVLVELVHPNLATGTLGGLALVLAFVGFGSLPLNIAGLLLLGLAILLFGLELTVTSHGLLGVGGIVCFVLGASALYTAPGTPTAPSEAVAWPVIATMAGVLIAFLVLALVTIRRVRRRTRKWAGIYGAAGSAVVPAGSVGVVRTPLAPRGIVHAMGEDWSARAADGQLPTGAPVRVVRQEGLTLVVEPAPPATGA